MTDADDPGLSPELVQHYRDMLRVHADDPSLGACPVCRRSRCRDWRHAHDVLTEAGQLPADNPSGTPTRANRPDRPTVGVGDIIEVPEQHYCYGLGRLVLRVTEVGELEQHSDGEWLNLRGIQLRHPDYVRLGERQVLVRAEAMRVRKAGTDRLS
jgi:hypothetical protein